MGDKNEKHKKEPYGRLKLFSGVVCGLISGVLLGLICQILISVYSITESHIIFTNKPPTSYFVSKDKFNFVSPSETASVHQKLEISFRNNGFKRGFVNRVEATPYGLYPKPIIEITYIDKTPIDWWEDKRILVEYNQKVPAIFVGSVLKFRLTFFDDIGRRIYGMVVTGGLDIDTSKIVDD
jgi:hypothetical protein